MACPPDEIGMSIIALSELAYALTTSNAKDEERRESEKKALELFLTAIQILEFPAEAACVYAQIRAALDQNGRAKKGTTQGKALSVTDFMIAAHALATGATLVSTSAAHFRQVQGLQTENWAR